MKEIVIQEYGRILRSSLGTTLVRRLHQFDEEHARPNGECIFDWGHIHDVRAQNFVGVVQIPGLRIEILPKIDDEVGKPNSELAQSNLLYMLAFTRQIPIHERDLASLRLQRMPLLEALLRIFVERLLTEFRKGIEHAYVRKEENSRFVRGKILLSDHIRHNICHQDRVFVAYDDFIPDTWLNRILKATCNRLIKFTKVARTRQRISEALLYLGGVQDVPIRQHHFRDALLHRNVDRFQELLDFCWIVLFNSTVAPASGASPTFSLLFPMECLFEEFIGRFIWKHAEEFGYARSQIHVQAASRRKWLLKDSADRGRFRLQPDIVFDDDNIGVGKILDTKWKRLKSDVEDAKNGVQQSDIYQLYAYAHRYRSPDNILLYPQVAGATPKKYQLAGVENKQLRIEFVNLNYDLQKSSFILKRQLSRIVSVL